MRVKFGKKFPTFWGKCQKTLRGFFDSHSFPYAPNILCSSLWCHLLVFTSPPIGGRGIVFDRFLCLFLCFFVSKITRKRLHWFAWNFQGRCGVTMGRPDYIFGQFWETARCRNAKHGGGVCCALALPLVLSCFWSRSCLVHNILFVFPSLCVYDVLSTRQRWRWTL